jgi:hypothetical protein
MRFAIAVIAGIFIMLVEICVLSDANTKAKLEEQSKLAIKKDTVSVTTKAKSDSVTLEYKLTVPKVTSPTSPRATAPVMEPQVYNLPGYNYPGISSLYSVPLTTQVAKDENTKKKIESTEKRIKLSYNQNYGGNEIKFEFELSNPSKEERLELYKAFIQQAREAQTEIKSKYNFIENEGSNIIISNYNSR